MTVRIRARRRGPLLVEGPCELLAADGSVIDLGERTQVLLCRCGHSRTTPICDGSHYRVDFDPPAERPAEESTEGEGGGG